MGNQEERVQPGKKKTDQFERRGGEGNTPPPPPPHRGNKFSSVLPQNMFVSQARWRMRLASGEQTATKRHIDSIWIQEGAVVARRCFLHTQAVSASQAAAEEWGQPGIERLILE